MGALAQNYYSLQYYLQLEETAHFKSEFVNGEIISMPSLSPNHNRIKENIACEIGAFLKKKPLSFLFQRPTHSRPHTQ